MKRLTTLCLAVLMAALTLLSACKLQGGGKEKAEGTFVPEVCFSFVYNGKSSEVLLQQWPMTKQEEEFPTYFLITRSWSDPDSGLRFSQETKQYKYHNCVEWVVNIENTGGAKSGQISDVLAADLVLDNKNLAGGAQIAYSKGTDIRDDDFLFVTQKLGAFSSKKFASNEGRSTSKDYMPYFNIFSEQVGYVMAIGWTGDWKADFRYASEQLGVKAGMQETDFFLYPGESVRTPSFAILEWEGKEEDSYNLWRAFMVDEHTQMDENGENVVLPIVAGAWGGDSAAQHLSVINYMKTSGLKHDAYWIDAGWFGEESRHSSDQYGDAWFKNAGSWYHNTFLYPDGLKPVGDAVHDAGMKFLLWFEPERAYSDSQLAAEHKDWLITCGYGENASYLFDFSNDEARQWMTDFIVGKLDEYGVDIYRQDFNFDPGPYWKYADEPNRTGVTQMKYIAGLYTYLEDLAKRHPGLIIDNCSGGGRRLDYEMMSRSLPMFRSDYMCFDSYKTTSMQVETDGLCRWVPFNGTCLQYREGDTYSFRSDLAYSIQFAAFQNVNWANKMIDDFHRAQPYFAGDYYRLTDASVLQSDSDWYAYQQHRDDLDSGFVLAFRRESCGIEKMPLQLRVPEGTTMVSFEDADSGERWAVRPNENGLAEFTLTISNAREARLIFYTIAK